MTEVCYNAAEPLPLDEECVHGRLGNGLTYYVRNNGKPEARAELRLIVKVGSVNEEDHEQGVAHMVEHLAFRGTAMFNTFQVVRFLEAIGAKFGACQNAYTAFDETVYFLRVPIDTDNLLERSLIVLREWAFHIRCTDDDVNKERGIVMEEWRQGRTAHGRTDENYFQTLMDGSTYARRLPIGKIDVIKHCKPSVVRDFYKKWYHPQRMAVVAVGDFDNYSGGVEEVVRMIQEILDVTPASEWREPLAVSFPHQVEPKLSIFKDQEATNASVIVDCKRPRQPVNTHRDYRRTILEYLFHEALSNRLYKLGVSLDPPFYSAVTTISLPTSIMETCSIAISMQEGLELRALRAVLVEVERVKRRGFSVSELSRAKANLMSDLEADQLEKDQHDSDFFCSEYVEHFCRGEPAMGVEHEVLLCKAVLPGITCEEVAAVARDFDWTGDCVVKITRPESSWLKRILSHRSHGSLPLLSVDSMRKVFEEVARVSPDLTDWEQSEALALSDVLKPPPSPGTIVSRSEYREMKMTELQLSNGMRVCYKKTNFLDDEVQFKGFAMGGLSELSKKQLLSGRMSTSIASEIGAFGVRPGELVDMLAGMRVTVNTEISTYSRAFGGECSPTNLEAALQMIHLLFTSQLQPSQDQVAVLLRMTREQIENQGRSPQALFSQKVMSLNTSHNDFFVPLKPSDVDEIDVFLSSSFFRRCFSDPSNFVFALSGNIEEEKLLALVEGYLASIPRLSQEEDLGFSRVPRMPNDRDLLRPVSFEFPAGKVEEHMRMRMVDPLCYCQVTFPMFIECSGAELRETMLLAQAMQLLETRLIDRLRFQRGVVYNVLASADFSSSHPSHSQPLHGLAGISWTCQPHHISTLAGVILRELEQLKAEGPTGEEVATRLEITRREFETSSKHNSWWVERMVSGYGSKSYKGNLGLCLQELEDVRQEVLSSLSPELLRQVFCRRFPDLERRTFVSLRPSWSTMLLSALRLRFAVAPVTSSFLAVGATLLGSLLVLATLRGMRGGGLGQLMRKLLK
ncbi:hypothetical protein GUITHDRAFT_143191 [Guillardia theta CCMP2712]|uniref:Uncharacterized protein n=1 Tax=Guillardia theta (strain CCMP2712) TaxID=905079 RepID=L1IVF5_GUITC|nr:hypothetical protein GUITHDRAFT_143191 [Guillardia theta CCMP2712]EKX39800.1 hypothetical protein GUITHDRAFT_143191 [Guillardia theta CCMP2712]|eukprot:XP_005826780.1 hypothetical protein GUITHDRAFT_143191 [Guillardia theta CCMP2712]